MKILFMYVFSLLTLRGVIVSQLRHGLSMVRDRSRRSFGRGLVAHGLGGLRLASLTDSSSLSEDGVLRRGCTTRFDGHIHPLTKLRWVAQSFESLPCANGERSRYPCIYYVIKRFSTAYLFIVISTFARFHKVYI